MNDKAHIEGILPKGPYYAWPVGPFWQDTLDIRSVVPAAVIKGLKWKHFPPYWPLVREIHRSPVNSPHKGQ